ncbi:MAG: alpha/beta fold hydrolase [Pseudomonadota bacterium]
MNLRSTFTPQLLCLCRCITTALAASFFLLVACAPTPENIRLVPSEASAPFNPADYRNFADYVTQTRQSLLRHKIYLDPDNAELELTAATPFELRPAAHCPAGSHQRGILLIHGLSDMPFAMRDLSEAFSERCFLVRSILLPGHGTRAGDLLKVSRTDWLNAARFGLETLKADVDEVYAGGFSLGGLLATRLAVDDPDLHGVFAFSPALSLKRAWQLQQSVWVRHLVDWADTDAPDDFARYEAMPINALAETYLLTQELREELLQAPIAVPTLLVQSADDAIIDAETNSRYFEDRFSSRFSRSIVYVQNPPTRLSASDPRVSYADSYLPKQRIIGFSHQSVHIAPTNTHYGVTGEYRNCGVNGGRSAADAERCINSKEVWWTEIVGDASPDLPANTITARLTFNPLFEQLMADIDAFITSLSGETA